MHFKTYQKILSPKCGMNLYRGCTHGCIYCDSRSKCYQMTHDFEDVEVKADAPALLEAELKKKKVKCMIATGSMSDPYLHLEEKLQYTKKCLQVIEKLGFGLAIQTKSGLILRDLDLLKSIHQKAKCVVQTTLTTADEELCKKVEPFVATTKVRVEVLKEFQKNQIPTVVWLCPLLPYINDTEENLLKILNMCKAVGVRGIINFGMGLTLREGSREYFYSKLDEKFPSFKERYHKKYGYQYEITSENSKRLFKIFFEFCKDNQIEYDSNKIFSYLRAFPCKSKQISFL